MSNPFRLVSSGAQQISQLLLGAEQRWRNAREEVIARWAEYTSLREKLGEVKQVEQHLKEFQLVRTEQRTLGILLWLCLFSVD